MHSMFETEKRTKNTNDHEQLGPFLNGQDFCCVNTCTNLAEVENGRRRGCFLAARKRFARDAKRLHMTLPNGSSGACRERGRGSLHTGAAGRGRERICAGSAKPGRTKKFDVNYTAVVVMYVDLSCQSRRMWYFLRARATQLATFGSDELNAL